MTRYILDCVSDTHGTHKSLKFRVPPKDLEDRVWMFVHAGDFTNTGRESEVKEFAQWAKKLPHARVLVVAGNHERETDSKWVAEAIPQLQAYLAAPCPANESEYENVINKRRAAITLDRISNGPVDIHGIFKATKKVTFLHNHTLEVDGIRVFGSPYTPAWYSWGYQYPRGEWSWDNITEGTHVVITHGPPYGVLDQVTEGTKVFGVGCNILRKRLKEVKPQVSVFGHIHQGFGFWQHPEEGTTYVNAASVDLRHQSRFRFIRVYGNTDTGVEKVEILPSCQTPPLDPILGLLK